MRSTRKERRRRRTAHFAVSQFQGNRIPFGLGMRLLYERWRYGRHAPFMMHEPGPPSFYKPAKPSDVEGFEIHPVGRGVDGVVPLGYQSYVWLPNPAWKWVEPNHEGAIEFDSNDHEATLMAVPVKWSEVAAANGQRMDRKSRWHEICGTFAGHGQRAQSPTQNWTWAPQEQNIEQSAVVVLADLLSRWTSPDDRCLCGKWEGGSDWDSKVRLSFPGWSYYIWSCRFEEVVTWLKQPNSFERSSEMPHVIWPENRSWFLAILYSGVSSYVAGPSDLIDSILESEVEAYEVEPSDEAH